MLNTFKLLTIQLLIKLINFNNSIYRQNLEVPERDFPSGINEDLYLYYNEACDA